jgi:hypothetical protein
MKRFKLKTMFLYTMPLDQDIEIIGLPQGNDLFSLKIVQLYLDGAPKMICASNREFHTDILAGYLDSKQVPFTTFQPRHHVLTSLKGERYSVVGMGCCAIYPVNKMFQMPYDFSMDYGLSPNKDFNERLKQQLADWTFY